MILTPKKLAEIGEALYGPAWMGALAKRLDTTKKTVQRWKGGRHNPPAGTIRELEELIDDQLVLLAALKDEINATRA